MRTTLTTPVATMLLAVSILAAAPAATSRAAGQADSGDPGVPLVHEMIVNAPVDQVWRAFTVAEEIETWMVPRASIDLRVGGLMRTAYVPDADLDGPPAIHNRILAYEPERMLTIQVAKSPAGFEFADLVGEAWAVIYFEPIGGGRTRVRVVGLGYGEGERWDAMRAHFEQGNKWTLEQLRDKFAGRPGSDNVVVLNLLHVLAGKTWVHEGETPDGRPFTVRNEVSLAADGRSVVATGWQDRGTGLVLHSNMHVWHDQDSNEIVFQNIGEDGSLARGRITLADADTLLWHWDRVGQEPGTPRLQLETRLDEDGDAYTMTLFTLHAGSRTEMISIDFEKEGGETPTPAAIERDAYLAHIGAAEAAFRLNETRDVRRWLDSAPARQRGWEWHYLDARSDTSRRSFQPHQDAIYALAISPDGGRLATGADDGSVKLIDAGSGATVATLSGHEGAVYGVAFSPSGAVLASSSRDRTIRLWDTASFVPIKVLRDADSHIMGLAFSPDGTRLAGTLLSLVKVWNLETGEVERTLEGHVKRPPVVAVDWSDDGTRIASGSWDNLTIAWDAASGAALHKLGPGYDTDPYVQFKAVDIDPSGRTVVAAGSDGAWWLWDTASGEQLAHLKDHEAEMLTLAFSPGGERLVTGSKNGLISIWDVAERRRLAILRGHTAPVRAVAYTHDGAAIVSAGEAGEVKVWSADPLAHADSFKAHESGPWGIAFTPDGRYLVTASSDLPIKVWDARTRQVVCTLEGHVADGASAACSPDGRRVITGANDRTARVWDLERGEQLFVSDELPGYVWDVEWSPDGRYVAACAVRKGFVVWDAETYEVVLSALDRPSRRLAFTPDGRFLAETGDDGTLAMWELATASLAGELDIAGSPTSDCLFSPDGRLVAIAVTDGTVRLWNVAEGRETLVLKGHDGDVYGLAFLAGGTRLATGAYDRSVRIWDVATGECTLEIACPADVYTLAATPDGSSLAWCPNDGTVVLYTVE